MVRAEVPATCNIYDGRAASEAAPPFAVFYFDTSIKSAFERDLLNRGPRDLRYQTTYVGTSADQVRWVADRVTAVLLTFVPAVVGRQVWPAIEESSQPVRPDDTSTGLFLSTAQWLTRSE
jgi:hypothetical protein